MTSAAPGTPPRLAVVSRGDPLTPYLRAALARRYPVVADVDVELGGVRRMAIAAATIRPTWSRWSGRYMKSNLGFAARSRDARRRLTTTSEPYDLAFQVHALFRTHLPATVIYIDCTYREAIAGWPDWAPLRGPARAQWLRAEQHAYRQAAHLFTITSRSRDSLVAEYGIDPGRITVVGAGVNFRTDPAALRHEVAPGEPTILFVGKEFDRKGGRVLFDAFAKVRAEFPDATLQMVGTPVDGPVPDGVEVIPMVNDRAQMDELYSRAGVFCLPSLFDPSPMVVLEAMGHGLPCVVSEGAAAHVRSLVEDGSAGWLTRTGDADGLAEGLVAYLSDRALARTVGDRARQAMAEQYTWDRVVDRMAPVLDGLPVQRDDANRA